MELNIVKKLIAILEESNLKKLSLKEGDFEIMIEKEDSNPPRQYHVESEHIERQIKTNAQNETGSFIKSPMVGTFYSSPAPDQPPFVKVGDKVTEDSVVCIIEAMKVMNELKANLKGTVVEILVDNAHPVEYGTKLFKIEP